MTDFLMPSLGADMESGTVAEWLVRPGSRVKKGDVVATVNGKPAKALALPDLRAQLRNRPAGDSVVLTLVGGRQVKLTLKDQI